MGHLELQCPHCEKRLRLSDEHAGKMIRCPACKQTFIVEASEPPRPTTPRQSPNSRGGLSNSAPRRAEPPSSRRRSSPARPTESRSTRRDERTGRRQRQEFVDPDASPWDDNNDIEDYDDPFVPQRAPVRRRQKSELPGKLLKVGLFLFVAMLIVGSVGGLGYFAFQKLGGSSRSMSGNKLNMAWFPQNVEAAVYAQPADIAQSSFFRKLAAKAPAQAGLRMQNIEPTDIESVLMGFWADNGSIGQVPGALTSVPFGIEGGWQNGTASLTVIRLKRDGLLPTGQKIRDHGSNTLYHDSAGMVSCAVDSRTILVGSEKSVIAALDGNGVEHHQPKLSHIPTRSHLVVAGVNNKSGAPSTNLAPGNPAEQIGQLIGQNARSAAIVADFSDDLSLTAVIRCHDEAGAVRVETELKSSIEKARQQMGLVTALMPVQGLGEVLTEMLNSSRIGRSADELILSAEVPSKLIDIIPTDNMGPPPMSPSGSRF